VKSPKTMPKPELADDLKIMVGMALIYFIAPLSVVVLIALAFS
jgi:hypothetical protein